MPASNGSASQNFQDLRIDLIYRDLERASSLGVKALEPDVGILTGNNENPNNDLVASSGRKAERCFSVNFGMITAAGNSIQVHRA